MSSGQPLTIIWDRYSQDWDRILTGSGGADWREITGYVTGWGKTKRGGRANLLQYGQISIKQRDKCQRDHLDQTVFCAKGDGVDSCQ
ncbi:hypothetical protein chiPu_0025731, partial [Chiloscyllium punctatum]|nr:hypothetical protein [Chiloscyllium punctatum]